MKNTTPLIRIHSLSKFDRGAKGRWLLEELGVAYEDRWLDGEKKEHEQPEYLRINPMGRVPVMEIADQIIFESGAICAVLADRYLEKGLAPALDSPDRAEYQQWMYFASSTLDPFQMRIMIIEDIPAGEILDSKLSTLQNHLRDAMEALDLKLARNDFLVANRFGAADIVVSYHLSWLPLWPELGSVMSDFPNVLAYIDRMKSRPSAVISGAFSYSA